MHSGRWAEAAHFFRPNFAPNLKMLSSGRRRAGLFDVGKLSTARERLLYVWPTAERGLRKNSERCHDLTACSVSSRPAPCGELSAMAARDGGDPTFGCLPPYLLYGFIHDCIKNTPSKRLSQRFEPPRFELVS
eukprot:2435688-Prymnesium_polylepis.1